MTSEAPKRIWLQLGAGEYGSHTWCDSPQDWADENGEGEPEYIRADLHLAAVAEVYEVAAGRADQMEDDAFAHDDEFPLGEEYYPSCVAASIRALTPADALAAREARDKQVRKQALREAADRIEELEAQLREARMQSLSAFGQADEAYKEKLAAEAKLERAVNRLEKLSRWLDLDDEELAAMTIEELPSDHRHIQKQVNTTLEELRSVSSANTKGYTDG